MRVQGGRDQHRLTSGCTLQGDSVCGGGVSGLVSLSSTLWPPSLKAGQARGVTLEWEHKEEVGFAG